MANVFQVIGYSGDGDRLIDTIIEDSTDEGPEFYAFKARHADDVICAQVFPLGGPGEVVEALVTQCDPGVEWSDIADAGLGD